MPEKLKQKQNLLIISAVVAIILVGVSAVYLLGSKDSKDKDSGVKVTKNSSATKSATNNEASKSVLWQWSGQSWVAQGSTPQCSTPLLDQLPVELSKVTAILYPGQNRGGNYKAHGGFRFGTDNSITVTNPMDAVVTEGSRYIEAGEVQYLFTFVNSCGLAYRFDHLHTLSPELQALAEKLPEAKVDDSRTTSFDPPVEMKKGTSLATKIGFVNTKNVSVDFGVYDLRSANQASKNTAFASTHENFKQFIFYGVCWLDSYPTEISTKLKALPSGDGASGKTSDYCK